MLYFEMITNLLLSIDRIWIFSTQFVSSNEDMSSIFWDFSCTVSPLETAGRKLRPIRLPLLIARSLVLFTKWSTFMTTIHLSSRHELRSQNYSIFMLSNKHYMHSLIGITYVLYISTFKWNYCVLYLWLLG